MFISIPCHAKTNTFQPLAGTGGHPKAWGFFLRQVCNPHFFFFLLAEYVQQTTPACFILSMHLKNLKSK